LQTAGLETKVARELLPRYAFARAAKHMAEQRIIRRVGEADGKIAFQFTKEYKDEAEKKYNYDFEATLTLDKVTGSIEVLSHTMTNEQCENLANMAKDLLAKSMENRTTADVTRVIKRLFEKQADLFPVRDAGSVYFVPQNHQDFVDRVDVFVTSLNGRLRRFQVPEGSAKSNKSVKEAVQEGLQQMIADHALAISTFGSDTRPSTVDRTLDRIETTRFKVEAYRDYLAGASEQLDETLAVLKAEAKQKLQEIMDAKADAKEQA
jgi:hypothetical protein